MHLKKSCKQIGLAVYVFCAIFTPPLLKINMMWVLAMGAITHLICTDRYAVIHVNKKALVVPVMLSAYILFNVFLQGIFDTRDLTENRIIVIYQWFFLIPMQIVVCHSICKILKHCGWGIQELIKLCIIAGILEGVLVLGSFLFPACRDLFLNIMETNVGNEIYGDDSFMSYRGYGFSSTLLDTFGYGMGLIAGICLLQKKWSVFTMTGMLFCLFSAMLNSRTGLLIFMVAVTINMFSAIKNSKLNLRHIGIISIVVAITIWFINTGIVDEVTLGWIGGGFLSLYNFFTGNETAYTLGSMQNSLLSDKHWHLPNNLLGVLFGEGHSCYGAYQVLGSASDVGYVNYIWIIGLLGTSVLIVYLFSLFKKKVRYYADYQYKNLYIFLGLAFFIMFVKGNIINCCAGTFITLLFICYNPRRIVKSL